MFCLRCGAIVPDGSVFCPNCGADVSSPAPEASASKPVIPAPVYVPDEKKADRSEKKDAGSVLTFGIIALILSCSWVLSFVGIVFACIAFSKAKAYEKDHGPAYGKARIGKIFAIVSIPLSIVMTVLLAVYIGLIAFMAFYYV